MTAAMHLLRVGSDRGRTVGLAVAMSDVVKLNVYLLGDPAQGRAPEFAA